MGTIKIPKVEISFQKYVMEAFIQWVDISTVKVFVSVLYEDGRPVTDLSEKNFTLGDPGGNLSTQMDTTEWLDMWRELEINAFNSSGSHRGFYWLSAVDLDTGGQHPAFPDSIFTVEAHHTQSSGKQSISYRGQCLAAMQTKERKGMGLSFEQSQ